MRLVEKETFYHITRGNKWNTNPRFEKGKTYKIGDQINPFFNYYYVINREYVENTVMAHQEIIKDYLILTRELFFEEIRRELYPELPSRYTCLWLIPDNLGAIEFWWKELNCRGRIVKLNVTGRIHEVNQSHLHMSLYNLSQMREKAIRYWNGSVNADDYSEEEILFEGSLTVEDVYTIQQLRTLF